MNALRSIIFYIGYVVLVLFVAVVLSPIALCLPYKKRFPVLNLYNQAMMGWLSIACGIRIDVTGREHLPKGACVLLSNHQSEWETLFLQILKPPVCTVLKKELLNIPVFGWSLRLIRPIALDRSSPTRALKQVIKEGPEKLKQGLSMLIFPEGTRLAPGERKPFAKSGALIACRANCPVVPIAHNAGHCWLNNSWIKRPGRITVVIGAPIETLGRDAASVTEEAEAWINAERERIGG
ncbi:lysophospholipid acyltransferase family protein [Zymobacter sp. IVIA_5232.4 C2]|uniref:lysophospholipid acyltransferase family protein n=1 Tax=Zymobacter sp. IVIA_5232.4 C2 TaxID=3394855 RepID=UPI0039C26AEF